MKGSMTEESLAQQKELSEYIEHLLEQDEVHWMPRSRANGLQNGDRNTYEELYGDSSH